MDKLILTPHEAYLNIRDTYEKKSRYDAKKSIFLGFISGIFIALGGFSSAAASHSIDNYGLSKLVTGAVFPVGLILIILCGTDLFTSSCLVSIPYFEKRIPIKNVIKNLITVYLANFLGAVTFAALIVLSGSLDANSGALGTYAIKSAAIKSSIPFSKALFSGILCNIVVCFAVVGSYAAKDSAGKLIALWFPIMAFAVSGFEHSVANMYYFSVGFMAKVSGFYAVPSGKSLMFSGALSNLFFVTIGNIIGGMLFAAFLSFVIYGKKQA